MIMLHEVGHLSPDIGDDVLCLSMSSCSRQASWFYMLISDEINILSMPVLDLLPKLLPSPQCRCQNYYQRLPVPFSHIVRGNHVVCFMMMHCPNRMLTFYAQGQKGEKFFFNKFCELYIDCFSEKIIFR